MVYVGKPSAGCENCRKAKKRCDQALPSCSRCARLNKPCAGYRDLTALIFRDETAAVARRAGTTTASSSDRGARSSSASASLTRQPSPAAGPVGDDDDAAVSFFLEHFVTPTHFAWFAEMGEVSAFLRTPMRACGLAALANRDGHEGARERARRCYGQAIGATNAAIRDVRRVREDETVAAMVLLACFERISWDVHSLEHSWKHHVEGAAQVLWLRGPGQVGTRTGALLFREIRDTVITNCVLSEQEVPAYIVEWSKLLPYDPIRTPSDHLALLATRCAALRAAFRSAAHPDHTLASTADALEHDLLHWATEHSAPGSPTAFTTTHDPRSPRAWNGARHVYGSPQALAHWTTWRSARMLLSRVQEALWRRSWPVLASPARPVPRREHFVEVRQRVVEDVCAAVALELGGGEVPGPGSVASGLMLMVALTLAGTCLIERLSETSVSSGGRRLIRVDRPLHLDPFDGTSTQLAWVIGRVDYVAEKVGVRWARTVSSFLKGEAGVYYEVCRSHIVRDDELDAAIFGEFLDLESLPPGLA